MNIEDIIGVIQEPVEDVVHQFGPVPVPFGNRNPLVVSSTMLVAVDFRVDDFGALILTKDGESQPHIALGAVLPDGEWIYKHKPTYWQNSDVVVLTPGTYHFEGNLFNEDNQSPYAYYAFRFSHVVPLEQIPCPEPPRTVCCND